MKEFMECECDNCGFVGKLGEDFSIDSKTHFEPYIGQVLDEFIFTCKKCGAKT